jgi:hypothetical protein
VACLLRLSLSLFDTQLDVQGQTSRHGFLAARMIQRIETHKKRMAQHGALGFQHVLRIKPIDVRRTDLTVQYGAPLRSFAKNSVTACSLHSMLWIMRKVAAHFFPESV